MGKRGLLVCLAAVSLVPACYVGASSDSAGVDSASGEDATASGDAGDTEDDDPPGACAGEPGPAPLRRLTRFEYNNVVRDLLGDDTLPANAFPSEVIGNGFGNDAETQAVSSLLAEQYAVVAEGVAERATQTPQKLAALAACAESIGADTPQSDEEACARELVTRFTTRAFRRPVEDAEIAELLELRSSVRETSTFAKSIAVVIEAVLQSPDFLYRTEWGVVGDDGRRRPSGHEMATRLSFFLWGSIPDDELLAAAESGELLDADGVRAQAERMLEDPRARRVVAHFFDNLLPISALSALERDEERYPEYSAQIGALMRQETQTFLEREIFENDGTWLGALTAEHTYMNAELAAYYGVSGVQGEEFQRVELDTTQRLGILTHAGVVAGTIHSNETNPVTRGSFLVQKMMCQPIPLPTGDIADQVKPPDPGSGATARERYSQHSEDPVCAGCHSLMDPVGFALENYDAIGRWRDRENDVLIDARGKVPGMEGEVDGPVELVRKIAESPQTQACFAMNWANFAYGRTIGKDEDCLEDHIADTFAASGYDIAQLLVDLTQTEAFLFLPEEGN